MFEIRGEVIAAIDFGEMVGLGCTARDLETPMVVMQSGTRRAALVVDEVEDVVEMDDRTMRAVPGLHPLAERALGMFSDGDGLLTVLLSLIHISEPTRLGMISYAVFCLKKK